MRETSTLIKSAKKGDKPYSRLRDNPLFKKTQVCTVCAIEEGRWVTYHASCELRRHLAKVHGVKKEDERYPTADLLIYWTDEPARFAVGIKARTPLPILQNPQAK